MRLLATHLNEEFRISMANFAKWILEVGNGLVPDIKLDDKEEEPSWIEIPNNLLLRTKTNHILYIAATIYSDFSVNYNNLEYLKERSIITLRNETVDKINQYVLSLVPGEEKIYLSSDTIYRMSTDVSTENVLYPIEFLNSLKFNGVSHHELKLKKVVPIMLLRNINQTIGLYNETRLITIHLTTRVMEAKIIISSHIGTKAYILHIIMQVTETKWPLIFKRRHFPVRVCYAIMD